jgi:hypothetical protein
MSRIHITIDRIVLHGVDATDRDALVNGMKVELTRLLGDADARGALGGSRRTPVLRLGQMPIAQGSAGAQTFGHGLARGIAKGVAR